MATNKADNTRLIFSLSCLIIVLTLILDRLLPEGMFLDGITYAAISRNLSIGKGSFWELYYRNEWIFSEHPPLMFGIQAIFFKIFGDTYLTEKIYSFCIWLLTALLIKQFWQKSKKHDNTAYNFGLPILLWTLIPTVTWAYTNNILDTTMGLLDLVAVFLLYVLMSNAIRPESAALLILLSGIFTFAATLTKGPVGLFPIAVPGLYWLVFALKNLRYFRKAFIITLLLVTIISGIYYTLWLIPDAHANIERYLNEQLMAALSGKREITGGGLGRLKLPLDLLLQIAIPVGISLILFIITKSTKTSINPEEHTETKKNALFFLLIGVCASAPIMLSLKQRTFYLIPSLPYYTLAISIVTYEYFRAITNRYSLSTKAFRISRMTLLLVSIISLLYLSSKIGTTGRDHELIKNIKYLKEKFPAGQKFGICMSADKDYNFLAYLQRYNRMEVNPIFYTEEYVLIDKEWCNSDIIPIAEKIGYNEINIDIPKYRLYKSQYPLHFDFTLLNPVFRRANR